MSKHPLCEVFGFPPDNLTKQAHRHRKLKLCPFNNKVPNCTKDKANDPLGVCSIIIDKGHTITCPTRFREKWIIAEDAANFFFQENTNWTSLTEIKLQNNEGKSVGNIDIVLVAYDDNGKVIDFGALEIQAVYISGNIRNPFSEYMINPKKKYNFDWTLKPNYPRPDFLSSSRKRLVPQLMYKGGILHSWNKKIAVAIHKNFYETLPILDEVPEDNAEIAWLIYDLKNDDENNVFTLKKINTKFTKFNHSLDILSHTEAGDVNKFLEVLQNKIDEKILQNPPDAPLINEKILTEI